jgi:hypothetical protein
VLIDFGAAIIRRDATPDDIWDERVVMEDDIGGLKYSMKTTLKVTWEQVKGEYFSGIRHLVGLTALIQTCCKVDAPDHAEVCHVKYVMEVDRRVCSRSLVTQPLELLVSLAELRMHEVIGYGRALEWTGRVTNETPAEDQVAKMSCPQIITSQC